VAAVQLRLTSTEPGACVAVSGAVVAKVGGVLSSGSCAATHGGLGPLTTAVAPSFS